MKWSTQKTIMFQAGIIKLCSKEVGSGNNIEERVEKIEKYLKSGNISVSNQPIMQTNINTQNMNYNQNNNIKVNNAIEKTSSNNVLSKTQTTSKQYSGGVSKSWPKIVKDLKQNGKIVLYTNLVNTQAEEINDMTVGIKFPKGITAFGKTVLEKQENIKEISTLVSMACGKEMQIKYISESPNQTIRNNPEDVIQKLAKDSDIPFNIED
jgi:DNA polymerase-3 subunit gamma/tau